MQRSIELEQFTSLLILLKNINEHLIAIDEKTATREDINILRCHFITTENLAVESRPIQEARYFAIKRFMDIFEQTLLLPLEETPDSIKLMSKNRLEGREATAEQIVSWDDIEALLERRLLGQGFAQAYLRVEKIIQRFIGATAGTPHCQTWQSRQHRIKENLLLGKI
jgi:hypothetical protein